MEIAFMIIIGLGALLVLTGRVWLVIKGFHESFIWGVGVLLLGFPVAILFFLFHREEASKPFAIGILGFVLMISGFTATAVLGPDARKRPLTKSERAAVAEANRAEESEKVEAEALLPQGDLMEARVRVMDAENDLAAETARAKQAHAQLTATNAKLNQKDQAAVTAYNKQVEAYRTQKVILDGKRAKVAAMQKELQEMIDSNPRGAAGGTTASAAPANASANVIIYTTKSCPHCVTAKNYFSGRRIPYKEMDVEASPAARQEYQKLNAQGVPVIVVNGEVIHGFNQAKIEQLLGGNT